MTPEQTLKIQRLRSRFGTVRRILQMEALEQCGIRTLIDEINDLQAKRDVAISELRHDMGVHVFDFEHNNLELQRRVVEGVNGSSVVYMEESSLTQSSIDRLIESATWSWDEKIIAKLRLRNEAEKRIDYARYNRFYALTKGIDGLEAVCLGESDSAFVDELISLLEEKDSESKED